MRYLVLFLSLISSAARSEVAHEICYSDTNQCVLLANLDGENERAFISEDLYNQTSPEERLSMAQAGLGILVRTDAVNNRVAPYVTREVRALKPDVDILLASQSQAIKDGIQCGLGVLGCGTAAFSASATYGMSYFLMKAFCAGAAIECVSAVESFNNWKAEQKAKREAEARDAGDGGMSGSIPPAKTGGGLSLGLDWGLGGEMRNGPKGYVETDYNPTPE